MMTRSGKGRDGGAASVVAARDGASVRDVVSLRGNAGWRGRLWRYGPAVFWIGFIFFASTGNLSASNTSLIVRPLLRWLLPDISEEGLVYAHFLVRKAAHLTEYAVLALLAARAFLTSRRATLRRHAYVSALALVALIASLDEYHQSFLASRTGTYKDTLLDTTGGLLALLALALWRKWHAGK